MYPEIDFGDFGSQTGGSTVSLLNVCFIPFTNENFRDDISSTISFSSLTTIFSSTGSAPDDPQAYNFLGNMAASGIDIHISNILMAGLTVAHHSHGVPVESEVEIHPSSVETIIHCISTAALSSTAT